MYSLQYTYTHTILLMAVSTDHFSEIHQLEKLRFLSNSRYKFKKGFWLSLNLYGEI